MPVAAPAGAQLIFHSRVVLVIEAPSGSKAADLQLIAVGIDAQEALKCPRKVQEGLADLLECGRRLNAFREVNPAVVPWRSAAALGLAQLGEGQRACALVEEELTSAKSPSGGHIFARPDLRPLGTVLSDRCRRLSARCSLG